MVLRTKRKIEGVKKHMKDYMKIYEQWLADPYFDEDTKNELRAIADDENEIKERFYIWNSVPRACAASSARASTV